MFKVGDEVVCVDDSSHPVNAPWLGDVIEKGRVYLVSGVSFARGERHLSLDGMFNPAERNGIDTGYRARRFRKVQRRDLTAWLATENTVEGPVRRKVKA